MMDKQSDFVLGIGNPTADERATYEIYANGYIWEHNNSLERSDALENDFHAEGEVRGGWDYYAVRGWVSKFDLDGGAQVTINGENVRAGDVDDYRPDRFGGLHTIGDSSDDVGDDETTPAHRNTGGSDGSNRFSSEPVISDGGYVVPPGDLQGTLDALHDASNDGPGTERRSYATLEPGATFDPGETVHLPRNMVVDAAGASIVPSASYDLFTFDLGSVLVRPYVNLRGVGDGDSYDARVFTFDPANITYGGDKTKRNVGYVDKDAWKPRDGQPHNKYRFAEHERQNFFANGSGVVGGSTLANPRDNSTLFYFHQNAATGWQCSSLALFESSHSARGVAYPVDIHSEGSGGFINDVVVKGYYVGWRVGITIRGDAKARKNRFEMDMQPEDGLSEHMMVMDNPTAQRNLFRGCSWDPSKASGPMWLVKRATGQNVLESLTGHGNGILEDRTGGSNRVTNPF